MTGKVAVELRTAADVAAVVRATRTRRQMSQVQLARAAGVSRRWLIDLEAGKPGATLDRVLTVLVTLGVPLEAGTPPSNGDADRAPSEPAGRIDLDAHLRRFDGPRR